MSASQRQALSPFAVAFRSCRRHFAGAAVFSGLLNLLYLAPTIYMLQVYDRVVPTRGVTTLVLLTVIFVVSVATLSLLDYLRAGLLVRASARLDRQLAGQVLRALMSQPNALPQSSAAMREFDTLRQAMTGTGILALFDAPWTPIYIAVCFLLHPALGGLAAGGAIVLLALAVLNERATKKPMQRANEAASRAYASLDSSIASAGVLRALGMRDAMIQRHLSERQVSLHLQAESSFAASVYMTLTKFTRIALQSLSLGLGAYLAIEQKISPGSIFAASLLIGRALGPIELVLGAWKSVVQAMGALQGLKTLFAQADLDRTHTKLPDLVGAVQLERVSLVSPTRDRLLVGDVTFSLEPGEMLGIIGPSGAGKSTLVKLMAGALLPSQGAIRFDGSDAKDWDEDQLARHIGYVPQETGLLQGTVKENITRFRTYLDGDTEALDAAAIAAAKLCGAHEMIARLPNGYDTRLGLGGTGLSAGQAQRIALARALFDKPSVVLMDEPNAFLDAVGEQTLALAIGRLRQNKVTVVVVAHRTNILADVDKLMLMRDGRIELFGPREEVMQRLASARPSGPVQVPTPGRPGPRPAALGA